MLENVDLQQILVLDIETVPQYPAYDKMPPLFQQLWEQKSRTKRADGESASEYYPRAGIWAEFGKIICISVGVYCRQQNQLSLRIKSFYGNDELKLLARFSALLKKQSDSLILCAHNGKEFDFPYLCRRMLINDLPVPRQLQLSGKKPWEVNHLDTMDLWKFGDYKNYTSLDLLAAVFNIPTPKNDITGADVSRVYWDEQDLERIKIYCQKDVLTTAQLLLRFKGLPLLPEELITIIET